MRTQALSRWLALSIALAAGAPAASAQPDVRDHRTPAARPVDPGARPAARPDPRDHRADPKAPDRKPDDRRPDDRKPDKIDDRRGPGRPDPRDHRDGPREAPPAPRAETQAPRAGYVWIPGRWTWATNKWEWTPGRWERERAGKRWQDGRWDRQGDLWVYVDGSWIDAGSLPPTPPPPTPGSPGTADPRPRPTPPRRQWKLERPVVSSYWPNKGKPGTRVVIRGRNFPSDAAIVWAGAPLRAAKVTADQIVFAIPASATSGPISIRAGRGPDLIVGGFEVAAAFDAEAEAKRLEAERKRKAEEAWAARQKQLARDRAAREAAARQREEERIASREQRRTDRLEQLRAKWAREFLADPETQAELTLHAQRVAELERMREIAEIADRGPLAIRIDVARAREDERHEQRMATLQQLFHGKGGIR
ncbi:MAG: IPT/TIG domain-containing protein [Kofleriaceae bacterium]